MAVVSFVSPRLSFLHSFCMTNRQNTFYSHNFFWLMFLAWLLSPLVSFAQLKEMDIQSQRLLLKLASTDLNVTSQNQIDIDRGIILAGSRTGINPMILISENFDDLIQSEEYGQIIKDCRDISELKRIASLKQGLEKARLLSLIGYYYAFMPERSGHDSAMVYFSRAKELAEIFHDKKTFSQVLSGLGKSNLEYGEIESGNNNFREAIEIASQANDLLTQARALVYWGTYSPFTPETTKYRIRMLRQADSLFVRLNSNEDRISTVTNIAFLSYAAGNVSDSKAAALLALELQHAINFPFTHYTNDLLAFITMDVEGQFGTSLTYMLDALKSVEATGDSTSFGKICLRIGVAYWYFLQDPQAEVWLRKGLSEFMAHSGNFLAMYRCMHQLCYILNQKGEAQEAIDLVHDVLKRFPPDDPLALQESLFTLAENQAELKQVSAAEFNVRKAYALQGEVYKRSGDLMVSYVYYKTGMIYFKLKQFENSRRNLTRALQPPTDLAMDFRANGEQALSTIDSAKGNYLGALAHYQTYILLKDSLYSRYQASLNQVLRIQYETERKDNNIKILEQEASLRESKIREDRFIKATMVGAVFILFLFIGLLYGRFRMKQKANHELEEQRKNIIEKNHLLAQLLREKEWLLKEVHHRVKNNLQIVISLLNTQSNYLDNDAAVKAIRESQDRMYAISLIHQKLYKSDENALIDVREYVFELLDHLKTSISGSGGIRFDVDVNDVYLDTTQAVLLGLILNESVSNSIKYAFDIRDSSHISVRLKPSTTGGNYLLTIADNGRGLPYEFDQLNGPSFGMRLMKGLSKQMGGSFRIISDKGVTIEIEFTDRALDRMMEETTNGVGQVVYSYAEATVVNNNSNFD